MTLPEVLALVDQRLADHRRRLIAGLVADDVDPDAIDAVLATNDADVAVWRAAFAETITTRLQGAVTPCPKP